MTREWLRSAAPVSAASERPEWQDRPDGRDGTG